jgi:hypothetical protein
MFVTKKALPRRTFLRGLGASLALPLLDAMVPASTPLAQTPAAPRPRFGAVYFPNGAIMEQWTPAAPGPGFELPPILKPLEPFRDELMVITNLTRAGGEAASGQHAVSSAGWLSGVLAKATEAEDVRLGITVDQVVANRIGQQTLVPSLELATEDFTGFIGGCTPGYSCLYMNTVSWATPTRPLPMETNPRVAFERLFGSSGTPEERAARMRTRQSILDSIREDLSDLERSLGPGDRVRVSEFLDNVREIERRIQRAESANSTRVAAVDAPLGIPESYDEHASLMFDLIAASLQSDLTRVFTFMLARELSNLAYPDIGVKEAHHSISHHGNNPSKIAAHSKVGTYHTQLFGAFVEKLKNARDGDASLLDQSQVVFGGGMGNGNAHAATPLPLVLVGRAGGIRGGRHLVAAERTPIANLWLSVANSFDCDLDSFGESTGPLELG